jgi:hypothetical protein
LYTARCDDAAVCRDPAASDRSPAVIVLRFLGRVSAIVSGDFLDITASLEKCLYISFQLAASTFSGANAVLARLSFGLSGTLRGINH